jgi:hypothetical protein
MVARQRDRRLRDGDGMIALVFLAGCFFGVLVGLGALSLCQAAAPTGFERDLEDIRSLPEVRHG